MAASGITVLPPLSTGLTLTSSHSIGTCQWTPESIIVSIIGSVGAFLGSSVDVLNGLANLRTDALYEDINIPLKIKTGSSPSPGINVTVYFPFALIKRMNI